MPIDMNKFIFHSSRIPFGAVHTEQVEVEMGGVVQWNVPRIIQSDLIPYTSKFIVPRISFEIVTGDFWGNPYEGTTSPPGTRLINSLINYNIAPYPQGRDVMFTPKVFYEAGGIRVGFTGYLSYSGTNPGSVTVPQSTIRFNVSLDVIPQSLR